MHDLLGLLNVRWVDLLKVFDAAGHAARHAVSAGRARAEGVDACIGAYGRNASVGWPRGPTNCSGGIARFAVEAREAIADAIAAQSLLVAVVDASLELAPLARKTCIANARRVSVAHVATAMVIAIVLASLLAAVRSAPQLGATLARAAIALACGCVTGAVAAAIVGALMMSTVRAEETLVARARSLVATEAVSGAV